MNPQEFRDLLRPVTRFAAGKPTDSDLADALNAEFPPGGQLFRDIETACHAAIEAGWMCAQGEAGRRFGRVIEPAPETGDLSVDVVDLENIVGPHHRHPTGEICMVMPVTEGARFDGHARGWCVFEAGSAHHPTVTGGQALVLYMLPQGKIEFTRPEANPTAS